MSEDATLDDFIKKENGETTEIEAEGLREDGFLTLPYDWGISTVDEVAKEGGFIDGDWIESADMDEDGEIQLVQLSHIGEGQFKGEPDRFITEEFADEEDCTVLSEGDLLISRMQEPILRACLLPSFNRDSVMAVDIARLQETEDWNRYFLKYLFNSRPVWKQGIAWASGTTRKRISRKNMENLRLPTPPLSEQRKIATVLYNVDQAIQNTEEIIKQTNRVRRGFIRERVVASNFEGERKEGTVGTRRVSIPENWSTVRLGDVAEIVSGKSFPREYQEGHAGSRAVIKVEDMNLPGNDKYIEDVTNRVTEQVLDELNKNTFPADTIIHPRVGEALLLNKTRITTEEAAFDDNIMGWIPNGINPEYLYYASTLVDFNAVAQTGTVPSINKEMAANFRFPRPPEDKQEQIAEDLSRIDGQVSVYEEKKAQLQRLKQGLMQDLLSGTVRTTDTNIEVPEEITQYG